MRNFAPLELPTSRLIIIITRSEFVIDQFLLAWKQKQKIVFENSTPKELKLVSPSGVFLSLNLKRQIQLFSLVREGSPSNFDVRKDE